MEKVDGTLEHVEKWQFLVLIREISGVQGKKRVGGRVGGQKGVERWVKTNVAKINTCHGLLDKIFWSFVEFRCVFCRLWARFGKSSKVILNIYIYI